MIMKMYKLWATRRRTRNELMSLSDKDLHDLGIYRGNIKVIVNQIKLKDM